MTNDDMIRRLLTETAELDEEIVLIRDGFGHGRSLSSRSYLSCPCRDM